MSKIALQGDASGTGTFTIAAPNSNSNPTLTLPTSSGTVVVTGGAQTIEFAAGTAASPSITFTGDTNTGIFSPAADTIAFAEGGAEAMRIDSSGNVGIGTSSPNASYKLDVIGKVRVAPSSGDAELAVRSPSGSSNYVYWSESGVADRWVVGCSNGNGDLAFRSGAYTMSTGTERMRIDSSGNVGIGTSSPAFKLDISGGGTTAKINTLDTHDGGASLSTWMKVGRRAGTGTNAYINTLHSGSDAVSALTLAFGTSGTGTEVMRIDSSGNVGIGTSSPQRTLGVHVASASSSFVQITNTTSGVASGDDGLRIGIDSNANGYVFQGENLPLIFGTNGTERARITAGGDLQLLITAAKDSQLQWFQPSSNVVQAFIYTNGNPELVAQCGGSGGVKLTTGATSWVSASDIRNKDIIEPITDAVSKVNTLSSVIYSFKDDEKKERRVGLVAQELLAVLPEAVYVPKDEEEMLGVRYTEVVPLLVVAIQELKAITDAQATRIEALEAEVAALKGQ